MPRRATTPCRPPSRAAMPVRSRSGAYLLEVDHVDDHAKGGEDLPRAMIALCPNCHTIKTRGAADEGFRERLRASALARHHDLLDEAGSG
ncbi:HNH endonuclease [Streptomyces sp. NPDC101118]|uniref:HNH endonuclease n=1 Tax=Streptomyces sp. NPDC101118 TaxID=3366109 RepID=UPI0038033095